jgi:hypothetical protein
MRIGKDEFDAALRPGFRRATQSASQSICDLRIADFPRARVEDLALEVCGEAPLAQAPEVDWLHAHGLAYKVLACSRPRPGAQG